MINGLPGNMASEVVKSVLQNSDFSIIPVSLTGPEIGSQTHTLCDIEFRLIQPDTRDAEIGDVLEEYAPFISVDFSHPSAVNTNAAFYCENSLPFVMGTTGGDRDSLKETADRAGIPAVIAPNMAKQIVGLQMMLEYASENFPDLFSGYSLKIRESHQQGKADTSGTAKAMVQYFNRMGVPFEVENIEKVRDPETQKNEWCIPEQYLSGHAYHTYTLSSSDSTVELQFRHNVRGRNIYALGTLDAVRFLQARIDKGETGCYSMLDVLRGDAKE